ncbi:MAG TPA: YhbY family RNA-binding protein, partial [Thermoanaerobaculia bacterium]
ARARALAGGAGGEGWAVRPVIDETRRSLEAHELIKVGIDLEDASSRRSLANELARAAGAEVAGIIGKIAILYRARDEKPKIDLPRL